MADCDLPLESPLKEISMETHINNHVPFSGKFHIDESHSSHNCHQDNDCLTEICFGGSKRGFEEAAVNALRHPSLLNYGLYHTLPTITQKIIEMFDQEELNMKAEINLEHYGSTIIRFINTNDEGRVLQDHVAHFDMGDLLEFRSDEEGNPKVSGLFVVWNSKSINSNHILRQTISICADKDFKHFAEISIVRLWLRW